MALVVVPQPEELKMSMEQMWKVMLARSFHPSQWWELDDDRGDKAKDEGSPSGGGIRMWVYRLTGDSLWSVGYYDPDRVWHWDSDHSSAEEAAGRVHWLNGGS